MRLTLIPIVLCILCSMHVQAQYIVQSFPKANQNPNGFNQADDIQNPMPGQGWTILYNESNPNPQWLSPIDVPFPFYVNKEIKKRITVSNTGVIAFDSVSITAPIAKNSSLPSNSIPNNSLCLLGLTGKSNYASIGLIPSARNPMIRTRVFGTAPYRQFWISFTSFSYAFEDSTLAALCNWAVVLEESSNFMYVVDQSTLAYSQSQIGFQPDTTNIALTVGLQLEDSISFMAGSSPALQSKVLNPYIGSQPDYTSRDNEYYVFKPNDAVPMYDLSVLNSSLGQFTAGTQSGIHITGKIFNNGIDTIRSFRLRLAENSGRIFDTVINAIALAPDSLFDYTTAFWKITKTARYSGKLWCDSINGNNADEYPVNDTLYYSTSYMTDPPTKRVLIENFTSTSCGECPRALTAVDAVLKENSNAIALSYHINEDPMSNDYLQKLALEYSLQIPSALVDRMYFRETGSMTPVLNIPLQSDFVKGEPLASKVKKLTASPAPIQLDIYHAFNNPTRKLTATLYATFHAAYSGDLRFNAMLVSDSLVGNQEYNQLNTMSGDTTIPVWGIQPSSISNFVHKDIVRHVLTDSSDIFGTPNAIPFDINLGAVYSKSYEFTIPADWNIQTLNVIGFIVDYNPDLSKSSVVNAYSKAIRTNITSIDEAQYNQSALKVYPSPATSTITVQCPSDAALLSLEIVSVLGERVYSETISHQSIHDIIHEYDISSLPNGVYYVISTTMQGKHSQSFIINR